MNNKQVLININEMKETIQDLRIWFTSYKIINDNQELLKLKDSIITIKLESELLLDKINKELIIYGSKL